MSALFLSSRQPLVASSTKLATRDPTVAPLARDAAVDHAATQRPEHAVNPLWMISAALAVLVAAMLVLVSTT